MNTATVQFFSKALHHHVTYTAILPNPAFGKGPFPVLYQLHGLTDDHTAWLYRSNLVRHIEKWPFIVILPDGGTSFYLNYHATAKYEDFMMEDLPNHVTTVFHAQEGKAAIGGLSMGGYGTLRLALKYSDRFASAWAHSAATFTAEQFRDRFPHPPADLEDADLFALATQRAGQDLPTISFDCGTEDFLLDANRSFHKHLTDLGISHGYCEHPGAHEWDYWDLYVREAIAQHADVFGLEPLPEDD